MCHESASGVVLECIMSAKMGSKNVVVTVIHVHHVGHNRFYLNPYSVGRCVEIWAPVGIFG